MSLNPLVVIPTYWSGRRMSVASDSHVSYDHMTPIDKEGELPRCLDSLCAVEGLGRIALLVVAEPGVENQAVEKVRSIAQRYRELDTIVVGEPELRHVHRQMEQFDLGAYTSAASLTGYGAVRNLGLLVASVFGHDTVIFLDDDEVVLSADFMERALYGIAMQTPAGDLITAKTGFFIDADNSYTAPAKVPLYDSFWNRSKGFNEYIKRAVALANDWELLTILKKNLRPMMKKSPLMDAKLYVNEMQDAFIKILDEQKNLWREKNFLEGSR